MHPESLRREWRALAPAWIKEAREGRNSTREGLLDFPMLEASGQVSGLRVLDCGCGEGRFCRILAERGADYVLGLDLSEPMIEAAQLLQSGRDEYRIADVQNMDFLDDASFDLVVSYLNQCDLPDFESNNREVFRILRSGGRFIIATLHPMLSATGKWLRNEVGEKQHVILDNYFDEKARHWKIMGVEITNFHRTLETHVNAYLSAGFTLERIIEPSISEEQLNLYPELAEELRVPNFIIFVLKKP